MSKKRFDCVEFQHQAGERLMRELEGMTPEQQVDYWREKAEVLLQQQEQIRAERAKSSTKCAGANENATPAGSGR